MATSDNKNQRFWEFYLVRYLVPSIVAGVCMAYIFIAKDYGCTKEFKNFKSLIEWLSKNFNTIMFIVWGVVSFAVMYLFSGITMFIHAIRSSFIGVSPFTFYSDVYHQDYSENTFEVMYQQYKESYRHFREHGTAFETSFLITLATIMIEPSIAHLYPKFCAIFLVICLLGTISGSYFGIYLELSLYKKIKIIRTKLSYIFWLVNIVILGMYIYSTYHVYKLIPDKGATQQKVSCCALIESAVSSSENMEIRKDMHATSINFNESYIQVNNMNINSFNGIFKQESNIEYNFNGSTLCVENLNINSYNNIRNISQHSVNKKKQNMSASICK
ncbi:MAG: hypothetical protein K2Y14_02830 [Burkholderiales bacterium]|nr:hypothetical protein [Burkholderiales bacterium]